MAPLVPILLSARGLTGQQDPFQLRSGDLVVAENCSFYPGHLLQKDGGATRVNATSLGGAVRVVAGIDWWPAAGLQRRVVVTSDGRVLKDDMTGAFATQLASGLSSTAVPFLAPAGSESAGSARKLFIANGVNAARVLIGDGATAAVVTKPPADWAGPNQPRGFFTFRGYNVGYGNANSPHYLYMSIAADHQDWLAEGNEALRIYPGEGFGIVAALAALSRAWIFKHDVGIYVLNDSAQAAAGWYAQPVTRDVGAAPTPWSIAQIDAGTVVFLSATGRLMLMQESGGTLVGVSFIDLWKELSLDEVIRREMNLARLQWSQVLYVPDRREIHVTYAASGETQLTRRVVIDFNSERARAEISTFLACESLWLERGNDGIGRPVAGSTNGWVYRLQQPTRTVDGAAYPMRVELAPTDFSDVDRGLAVLKHFRVLHLEFLGTGGTITVRIFVDGKDRGTVTFDLVAQVPQASRAFQQTPLTRWQHTLSTEGYYLSLQLEDTTAGNPQLVRAWVDCDPTTPVR